MRATRWAIVVVSTAVVSCGVGVAAAMPSAAAAAPNCTATWVGRAGASWSQPRNWSPTGVPTAASGVCILTAAGPTVTTGQARRLYLQDTTMTIGTELIVGSVVSVTDSTITGTGVLHTGTDTEADFAAVQLAEQVTVDAPDGLQVSGARAMCGGSFALCLQDSSSVDVQPWLRLAGDIGGTSDAPQAVRADSVYVDVGGPGDIYRIDIRLTTPEIFNRTNGASLILADWSGLAADGTLTGAINYYGQPPLAGPVVLPRSVTAISASGFVDGVRVQTPDGSFAAAAVARIDGGMIVDADAALTPPSGTLPVGGTLIASGASTDVIINGTLQVSGRLNVDTGAALQVTGPVDSTAMVSLSGTLTTPALHIAGPGLYGDTGGRLNAQTVTVTAPATLALRGGSDVYTQPSQLVIPNGAQLLGGPACGSRIVAFLTLRPTSTTQARLIPDAVVGCRGLLQVAGPVHLDGTLHLSQDHGTGNVGDQVVVLRAESTRGLTGHFRTVTGTDSGPNHWEISYTTTQVIATLVAGNA